MTNTVPLEGALFLQTEGVREKGLPYIKEIVYHGRQTVYIELEAPTDSTLHGTTYRVEFTFPQTYTDNQATNPPFIRFRCITYHSHVGDDGDLTAIAFQYFNSWWEKRQNPVVLDAVQFVHDELLSNNDIDIPKAMFLENWSEHPAECTCQYFPIPYPRWQAIDDEIKKQEVLQRCLDEFNGLLHMQQRTAARRQEKRLQAMQQYKKHRLSNSLFSEDTDNNWLQEWFDASYLQAHKLNKPDQWKLLLKEECPGVFSFPLFTPQFCQKLLAEIDHYNSIPDLPKNRPNSMNNYGLIINDIGMERMLDILLVRYLRPLAAVLYPEYGGATLDYHHSFVVAYDPSEDVNLDMHIDDSDVTFNVNLQDGFEGSELAFCGKFHNPEHRQLTCKYKHIIGRCVIHVGVHRHGALDISGGKRSNLIVWGRSYKFRNSDTFRLTHVPSLKRNTPDSICLSRTHDKDYEHWKAQLQ